MAVGNSGDVTVSQTSFYGGMGTDLKIGIKNSYANTECMDARKSPSSLSVLPGSRKITDSDLTGIITCMEQTPDGNRWGVSTSGKLFKIDSNNDITQVGLFPNWYADTHGDIVYWPLTDSLYITGLDRIYSYSPVLGTGTPAITSLTGAASTYPTVAQILVRDRDDKWIGGGTDRWTFKTGGAGTYSVPTSISEADNDKCIFLPDQSPMIQISAFVRAKPASGTITLTVHDEQNKVIASSTLDAAVVTAAAGNVFGFSQTKLGEYKNFGTEYHIHMTASVSGFTVDTYEASKLYGLHFYFYSALLTDTIKNYHPIINWAGSKLLIGNGQYLVDWLPSGLTALDASEFQRHRVIVENGMEVTSLTSNDEYVVMGCEKVSTAGSRIYQKGMLGFWDGFADAINFKIDTPMGEPKSLYTYQNITYMIIDGAIYAYTGSKILTKVRTMQDSQSEFTSVSDSTDVFAHCMAVRRGILLMAYPSITSLTTMRHGIYSWGSIDKNYPNSFYYSYNIPESAGNYNTATTQYSIGGVWNFGDTLYFSYSITNTTNKITIANNESLWELGNINATTGADEAIGSYSRIRYKSYITVVPGTTYKVNSIPGYFIAVRGYDSSNNYTGSIGIASPEMVIPAGTTKIRLLIISIYEASFTTTWSQFQDLFTANKFAVTLTPITYNLAVVDNTSKPATAFKYESLSYDGGAPWKYKMALRVGLSCDPLPTGSTITLKYKIDNNAWVDSSHVSVAGETESFVEINKRFRTIQFGFSGTNTSDVTTSPVITGIALNARELNEESKVG